MNIPVTLGLLCVQNAVAFMLSGLIIICGIQKVKLKNILKGEIMLKVETLSFKGLSDDEKDGVSNNGFGKEYANYIKITHNGVVVLLESDAMEPEDAIFGRDLSWVADMLEKCYDFGVKDERELPF